MRITIETAGQLAWLVRREPSGRWLAECKEMGLATEATSLDELYSVIWETIELTLCDLLEENELDAYLRERGWTAERQGETADDVQFNLPWQMITEGMRDTQRRAH